MSRRGTLKRNALAAREVIMVVHEQRGQRVGLRPYTVGNTVGNTVGHTVGNQRTILSRLGPARTRKLLKKEVSVIERAAVEGIFAIPRQGWVFE
ncbi:hypothetical protein NC651_017664 [Populus alba x Populus x berolinensis]|nr:hypothetical protein NC651_017664 [Populus alba x Populus x berolinensis]